MGGFLATPGRLCLPPARDPRGECVDPDARPRQPLSFAAAGAIRRRQRPCLFDHAQAYDLLTLGFGPGFNGPLFLVAQLGSSADTATLERLTQALAGEAGVAAVVPFPSQPGAKVAIVKLIPRVHLRTRAPVT